MRRQLSVIDDLGIWRILKITDSESDAGRPTLGGFEVIDPVSLLNRTQNFKFKFIDPPFNTF